MYTATMSMSIRACASSSRPLPRSVHLPYTRSIASTSRRALPQSIDTMVSNTIQSMVSKLSSRQKGKEVGGEGGLRMLMFGKPGSGKGTLSARLVKEYDIAFVSTGDVLRKEIRNQSAVGREAEAVVASGGLVPDELMLQIIKAELDRLRGKSWILDGFPRTLQQGELLDGVLNEEGRPLNMIVHLNVPDQVIMARIEARWVHLPSGRVYNTSYSAPKVPGKDDVTGEPLSRRPDDTPVRLTFWESSRIWLTVQETFSKRLKAYYESTAPLLEYFAKAYPDTLISLSGNTSDEVLVSAQLHLPQDFLAKLPQLPFPPRSLSIPIPPTGQLGPSPSPLPSPSPSEEPSSASYPSGGPPSSDRAAAVKGNPKVEAEAEAEADGFTSELSSLVQELLLPSEFHGRAEKIAQLALDPSSCGGSGPPPKALVDALALDQLWPQLAALVEPFGLRRREAGDEPDVEPVRREADDLRDSTEEAVKEKVHPS